MYPRKLYKCVLLLDGKIVNWKCGPTLWDTVDKAFCNRQFDDLMKFDENRFSVDNTSKIVHSVDENNEFFEDTEWFEQWFIHENYIDRLNKPY